MQLSVLVFTAFSSVVLPNTAAIMGSPPRNLPNCLNGGSQKIEQDRYTCGCPLAAMDRQCKLTRITVGAGLTEMQREPNSVEVNSTHSFHLGLQYITNDATGNGVILIAKNEQKQEQISIYLNAGRPELRIAFSNMIETIKFAGTIPVTNDNAWHHLDIFFESDPQNQLVVFMSLDRCRDLVSESCLIRQTIRNGPLAFKFGTYIQIGANLVSPTRSMEGCVDKVVVQNELLDFYEATWDQPSKQGCANAEQGCIRQSQRVCGVYGICQNALRATDMLTCTCRPGYRPDTSSGLTPDRWPCNSPSSGWSINSTSYNARFLNKVPARLRLSFRTRDLSVRILVVASWKLYLTVTDGIPRLQLREKFLELENINVSDGNWHLYEITITPNILELRVDELDKDFQKIVRLDYFRIVPGPADVIVGKDADAACLDDVWVDFRDTWKNTEYDYPLEIPTKRSYTRYVDWPRQGLTFSCAAGTPQCPVAEPNASRCDASAVCVDEWRGFRCECPPGSQMDEYATCHSKQCLPNPCLNGECVVFNQTSNFTCQCFVGWMGERCELMIPPASSGFEWWWILLIVLLLLLLVLLALSLLWCCPRNRKQKASTDIKSPLDDDQIGNESQLNDPWDTGDKGYSGPLDTPDIYPAKTLSQLEGTNIRNGDIQDSASYLFGDPLHLLPREYGQKTSDIPPWEKFEGRENPTIKLDQALEYGYEGFDGKPPPEFCADEPSSLAEDEDNNGWFQRSNSGLLNGQLPQISQDNR